MGEEEASAGEPELGAAVQTFVRAAVIRGLLEAQAVAQAIDALDEVLVRHEPHAHGDAVIEHVVASLRRRRDALVAEHAALVDGWGSVWLESTTE